MRYGRALAGLLLALLLCSQVFAQTTTTTTLPSGNTQTTQTWPPQTTNTPGGGTETTTVSQETEKDPNGNLVRKVTKKSKIRKDKNGKQVASDSNTTTQNYNFDGSSDITDSGSSVNNDTGEVEETQTDTHHDEGGHITKGHKKITRRKPGGSVEVEEFDWAGGQWIPSPKPERPNPKPQQTGDGAHDETAYLPDVAGPGSTIVATFDDPQSSGPRGTAMIAFEDRSGHRNFFQVLTNAAHKTAFKVSAGTVAVWLFKHFDERGNPDSAAVKTIVSSSATVEGTEAVAAPRIGPAIVRAATAYERGGASGGIFSLQTQTIDPLHARALIDGQYLRADTLAASDRSLKARFVDTVPLGRHTVAVASANERTNSIKADLVTLQADPVPPGETGSLRTLRVHVDGLPRTDRGVMYFHIAGSARLENGAENAAVPVQDGTAEVRIRGERSGAALVQFTLHALLDVVAGETTTGLTREKPGGGALKPPPTPTPTPLTPGDIDKPVIYGHDDYSCQTRVLDAWMEPTQGAWQDDVAFPDQDGKQLVRDKDTTKILYHAELPMVQNRNTVLSGVDHYRLNGAQKDIRDRDHIVFKLRTNCTRDVTVHYRFEVSQITPEDTWDDGNKFSVPLAGAPSQNPRIVEIALPATDGIPPNRVFRFEQNYTRYLITAKIVDDRDRPTGLQMDVDGDALQTFGFSVHFVPVIISASDTAQGSDLNSAAKLGSENTAYVNDYYPVADPSGPIIGIKENLLNVSGNNVQNTSSWALRDRDVAIANNRDQALFDAINDQLPVQTLLENGGRVVAVLTYSRFYETFNPSHSAGAYTSRATGRSREGEAVSFKFIVEHENDVSTVTTAHELAHTLVPGWMKVQADQALPAMAKQCKVAPYHDVRASLAFGMRLYEFNAPKRDVQRARTPIMSSPPKNNPSNKPWIAQCTYWLLSNVLKNPVPDPNLILVRGIISRRGSQTVGLLGPAYDLHGIPNLEQGGSGPYRIVLRDNAGASLATYNFDAPFYFPEEPLLPRKNVPFAFTVAEKPGTRRVDLYRGRALLSSFDRAADPPKIALTSAIRKNTTVTMTWDAPAYARSTILYALNGRDYIEEVFESLGRRAKFTVDKPGGLLKLIVSKDGRSSETTRRLR